MVFLDPKLFGQCDTCSSCYLQGKAGYADARCWELYERSFYVAHSRNIVTDETSDSYFKQPGFVIVTNLAEKVIMPPEVYEVYRAAREEYG
eukprot:snap_masked-scaffold_16-processed-gene-1.54-mRNA-1 protein AED:1.00 eAED:1.00 QI:0/0/0/0/1/1/2/0/90